MKTYLLDDIAQDVRIALDQNKMSDTLVEIGDVDTLSLNEIIKSKIVEAVTHVHCGAPNYLLDGGHDFGDAVYWKGDKTCGHVLLPEDFMRFVVFEMDDWERPVFNALSTDDPEYDRQSSRFAGIRGTAQKPVCFIAVRPEGRVLEFYSSKSQNACISRAMYLPYPTVDELGAIEICQRCYLAVVYTTSALVLTTYGETEKANLFTELANKVLK